MTEQSSVVGQESFTIAFGSLIVDSSAIWEMLGLLESGTIEFQVGVLRF